MRRELYSLNENTLSKLNFLFQTNPIPRSWIFSIRQRMDSLFPMKRTVLHPQRMRNTRARTRNKAFIFLNKFIDEKYIQKLVLLFRCLLMNIYWSNNL